MRKFEIKVSGNLGEYKQSGYADIFPKDILDALGTYFAMPIKDKKPVLPIAVPEGDIKISVRYTED